MFGWREPLLEQFPRTIRASTYAIARSDMRRSTNTKRKTMNRLALGASSALLIAAIGLAIVMAKTNKGPAFIAGDQPVTEEQVRQKLQTEGWSNVQVARDGRYIEAIASKDGQNSKIAFDSLTGRLRAADDDDD